MFTAKIFFYVHSKVLKHLAKEVKVPYSSNNRNCDKPVDNYTLSSPNNEWNYERDTLNQPCRSKSQPDLTRLQKTKIENPLRHTLGNTRYVL